MKKSLAELSLYWSITSLRFLHGSIMTPVPCGFSLYLATWTKAWALMQMPPISSCVAWLLRSLSSWYDIVQSAAARLLEALASIDGALLYLIVSLVVPFFRIGCGPSRFCIHKCWRLCICGYSYWDHFLVAFIARHSIFRYLHGSQVLNATNSPVERAVLEGQAFAPSLAAVRLMEGI